MQRIDLGSVVPYLPFSLPWLQTGKKCSLSSEGLGEIFSEGLGEIFSDSADLMARDTSGKINPSFIRIFTSLIMSSYMI